MGGKKLTPKVHAEIKATIEGGVTPEEEAKLKTLLETIDPKELEKLEADVRTQLDGIIAELQEKKEVLKNPEYSMDYLKENTDGFLGKLLDIKITPPGIPAIAAFTMVQSAEHIGSELLPFMPKAAQENFQILVWDKIVQDLGFSSALKFGATSFFSGFTDLLGTGGEKVKNATSGGIPIETFTEIADSIQNFDVEGGDKNGSLKLPKELAVLNGGKDEIIVPSGIEKGFKYLESLSVGYFQNMKVLLALGKEQGVESSEDFKNLLAHPSIMKTLLDKGNYNENGIEIDLKSKKLQLAPITAEEIKDAGKKAMAEILGSTNSLSGKIDNILSKTDKFVKVFEKLGINPTEIKETLFGIPIIGFIFKILFGDFLDTIEAKMSKLNTSPEVKAALTSFSTYIQESDNKEKLPFTLNTENPGALNDDETMTLKGFVKKVQTSFPGEKSDERMQTLNKILNDPKLAEKVFTGTGIEESDTFLKQVHEAMKGLFSGGAKPTQKEFFEKLKKIKIEDPEIPTKDEKTTPEDTSIEKGDIPTEDTNTDTATRSIVPPVGAAAVAAVLNPESDNKTDTSVPDDTNTPTAKVPGDPHPLEVSDSVLPKSDTTLTEVADAHDPRNGKIIPDNKSVGGTEEVETVTVIPSIEEQIAKISQLPAKITLENKNVIDINLGPSGKTLEIGGEQYSITIAANQLIGLNAFQKAEFQNGVLTLTHISGIQAGLIPSYTYGEKKVSAEGIATVITGITKKGNYSQPIFDEKNLEEQVATLKIEPLGNSGTATS